MTALTPQMESGSPHRLWESEHTSLLAPIGWHCSHQVDQGELFWAITVEDRLDDVRGEVDKFERPANIGLVLSKVIGEVDDRALVFPMLKLLGVLVCGRDGLDQHLVPLDLARRWRDQLRDVPVLAKIARNLVGVWRMFTALDLFESGIDEKLLDPAHVELDPDAVRIDDDLAENIVHEHVPFARIHDLPSLGELLGDLLRDGKPFGVQPAVKTAEHRRRLQHLENLGQHQTFELVSRKPLFPTGLFRAAVIFIAAVVPVLATVLALPLNRHRPAAKPAPEQLAERLRFAPPSA